MNNLRMLIRVLLTRRPGGVLKEVLIGQFDSNLLSVVLIGQFDSNFTFGCADMPMR